MYECQDCGHIFEFTVLSIEKHGLDTPPFEKFGKCPVCSSGFFREIKRAHCRCCGARLPLGRIDYCDEYCRKRGNELWKREALRRTKHNTDPLTILLKQIDEYNKLHSTRYSYGQFVALVLPTIKKGGKKNDYKR